MPARAAFAAFVRGRGFDEAPVGLYVLDEARDVEPRLPRELRRALAARDEVGDRDDGTFGQSLVFFHSRSFFSLTENSRVIWR